GERRRERLGLLGRLHDQPRRRGPAPSEGQGAGRQDAALTRGGPLQGGGQGRPGVRPGRQRGGVGGGREGQGQGDGRLRRLSGGRQGARQGAAGRVRRVPRGEGREEVRQRRIAKCKLQNAN